MLKKLQSKIWPVGHQSAGCALKFNFKGLPWWSSGKEICPPMQRTRVRSLVGELRSHMPRGN